MKKLLVILIFILVLFSININFDNQYKDWRIISYRLENKNLRLLVADNANKWEKGLMYFKKLDKVDGMIFNFPDKQYRTFWNKNTYIDLNIFWIDDDKTIGTSYLPAIKKDGEVVTVNSPSPVNKVIELKK